MQGAGAADRTAGDAVAAQLDEGADDQLVERALADGGGAVSASPVGAAAPRCLRRRQLRPS
jgi:hypothetical protein